MANSKRLRLGVFVDRQRLAHWQAEALRTLGDRADLFVYSCGNTPGPSRRWKFALYYLLNLFTIRNRMTRRLPWPVDLQVAALHEFETIHDGGWQVLPAELIDRLRRDRIDVLVKFGLGLLRVPVSDELPLPILSYHHGDPAEFRGRPAGFYEMLRGKTVMGQVVQRVSNYLDAGDVLAFAETKVHPHSYRSTLMEAYRHSPLILRRAVENQIAGRVVELNSRGKNYRLPGNALVIRFVVTRCIDAVKRLLYGLFREKQWKVATTVASPASTIAEIERSISHISDWHVLPTPKGFRFLADPFLHPEGGVLVEGMNNSGRGKILHVNAATVRCLSARGGHFSYPALISSGSNLHIVPEVSDWSPANAFPVVDGRLGEPIELKIPGRPALLDPTPYSSGEMVYLFANRADEGPGVLRLWTGSALHGAFAEHPSSPVRLSPRGSRMAGGLFTIGSDIYRVGQDFRGRYGDGLVFFRVIEIDPERYREEECHSFRFGHVRGPHTLNLGYGQAAFDFYVDRFSVFAGARRLKERLAARRIG
jgi:hypothetical protein